MRPTTQQTQAERSYAKGAFNHFVIRVTPPDLRAVIARRLRRAFTEYNRHPEDKSLRITTGIGKRLVIADPERSLNLLSRKVLTPKIQEIFLQDICNDNVRQALVAFERFCRYRELRYHELFLAQPDDAGNTNGEWFDHLIDGLMVGDQDYFTDGPGPIFNILAFESNSYTDYIIIYLSLSLLTWGGRPFVQRSTLLRWLARCGYANDIASDALCHLLKTRLAYSPETEDDLARARNIKISNSGSYHLRRLVENPRYLWNVVYDVPSGREAGGDGVNDNPIIRMNSIRELIETIYEAEKALMVPMLKKPDPAGLLGSVDHSGMLTRRLLNATMGLSASQVPQSQISRDGPGDLEGWHKRRSDKLRVLESKIRQVLRRRRQIPPTEINRETIEQPIGASNDLRFTVPRQIAPASKNTVSLEIGLEGVDEGDPLVAFWRSETGPYQEITQLIRTNDRAIYKGDFVISDVQEVIDFPPSKLTVFRGSEPILVANIAQPSRG
jgi:hypothetical protein